MKRARTSLVIGLMLALAGAARADLCAPGLGASTDLAPTTPCERTCRSDTRGENVRDLASGMSPLDGLPLRPGALADYGSRPLSPSAERTAVEELPGLPGSASLFLSAALSVGAWHVVRKSRDINLSHLPDWYHPDAPGQIGHSVAVDLQFAPLVVCEFAQPRAERPVVFRLQRELSSRCESQHFLHVEAPRGPPLASR